MMSGQGQRTPAERLDRKTLEGDWQHELELQVRSAHSSMSHRSISCREKWFQRLRRTQSCRRYISSGNFPPRRE